MSLIGKNLRGKTVTFIFATLDSVSIEDTKLFYIDDNNKVEVNEINENYYYYDDVYLGGTSYCRDATDLESITYTFPDDANYIVAKHNTSLVTVEVEGGFSNTVKGKWRFNNILTQPTSCFSEYINFTFDYSEQFCLDPVNGSGIGSNITAKEAIDDSGWGLYVQYTTANNNTSTEERVYYQNIQWGSALTFQLSYQVVDFGETEQAVSDAFYNWFINNAIKGTKRISELVFPDLDGIYAIPQNYEELENKPIPLPSVSSVDNGKILRVVDGRWAAVNENWVYAGMNLRGKTVYITSDVESHNTTQGLKFSASKGTTAVYYTIEVDEVPYWQGQNDWGSIIYDNHIIEPFTFTFPETEDVIVTTIDNNDLTMYIIK